MDRQPFLTFAFCSMLLVTGITDAKKLYRWTDDDGNVFYSDRVPPDQVEQERSVLDQQGIEVGNVEKAKTRAEQLLEKERQEALAKLRAEQQKAIEEQKAKDTILLRTFSSEEDILLARDNRLTTVDVAIQLLRSNLDRVKSRLADLQKEAADLERQGKQPGGNLAKDIEITRSKLSNNYANMIRREREKETIFASYAADLERFRELKNISAPIEESEQDHDRYSSLLQNVFSCADAAQCAPMWKVASDFARRHATTRLQLMSETIVMTAPARAADDVSITVSRLDNGAEGGFLIFMDLQCSNTPSGDDLCSSDQIRDKKLEFSQLMQNASPENPTSSG